MSRESKIYFELDRSENKHHNLWDTVKAILRGNCFNSVFFPN